ncbi:phosphonate metabolism transcriptional regulator PhnF [Actibacterium sp. D379-3]
MQDKTWETVRDTIEQDIQTGRLKAGDRLPTEQKLVEQHDVGRHSVRRAVADLAKKGLLSAEQGRGTFVARAPIITYELSRRTRLRDNLASQGIDLRRERLDARVIAAPNRVAEALKLLPGTLVSAGRRLTFADNVPIAVGEIYHPADRFPGYLERREVLGSVTETYKSYGIDDYLRGATTLYSRQAKPEEARLLRQHKELTVTVICAVDTLMDGTPISFSRVVWSAPRVKFTFLGG